jgi:predicted nucleic acid-binding protein
MAGLTLDTGALIALERRRHRMRTVFWQAVRDRHRMTIPAPVIAEWWRARTDLVEMILAAVDVEPMDAALGKTAGKAIAAVRGATATDAVVMASAARRGDIVYTSDLGDLSRLVAHFPNVRVLGV